MFATPAYAQTAPATSPAGAPASSPLDVLAGPLPLIIGMLALMYFMLFRPQQQRMKKHQEMVSGIKRGDTVVLSSGLIGKVARVEDAELQIEIAANTTVRVVRSMVNEVRARGEPAPANDAPAAKPAAKK
jgi:preprotein translocase subunit YajC